MARLKFALLAAVVVAAVCLIAGCRFYASESYREEPRGERYEHNPHFARGRVAIVIDEDWIHRYGPSDLYIDGRFYGHVDRRMDIDVDEGEHDFEFRHKDFSPYSERISVRGGGPSEIHPRFSEERRPGRGEERGEKRGEERGMGRGPR